VTAYGNDGAEIPAKDREHIFRRGFGKQTVVDGDLAVPRWPIDLPACMREMMKMVKQVETNQLLKTGAAKCPDRCYPSIPSAFLSYWFYVS
jgi:hypothetical protein